MGSFCMKCGSMHCALWWSLHWHCVAVLRGGGVEKNILVPAYSFFFEGYPWRRGGRYENSHEIFSGPQNLKFPKLYPNSLGLEGARGLGNH